MTATEARKFWFRLLDEVVRGEVYVVERNGTRVVIQREDATDLPKRPVPDYSDVFEDPPDMEEMATWGWDWEPGKPMKFIIKKQDD